MTKTVRGRPPGFPKETPEFPKETHKKWSLMRWASWQPSVYATGTLSDIKREVSNISVWEDLKPHVEDLKQEAKKNKIKGLYFEVRTRMAWDESTVEIWAHGYRPKTEKELVVSETAREQARIRREREESRKAEAEKQQLLALQKKYPELRAD